MPAPTQPTSFGWWHTCDPSCPTPAQLLRPQELSLDKGLFSGSSDREAHICQGVRPGFRYIQGLTFLALDFSEEVPAGAHLGLSRKAFRSDLARGPQDFALHRSSEM